jgi:hypothetical protein
MSRRTLLVLALSACCTLMLACAAADNANNTNATNASNANRAATNAATTTTTPATTTSPASSTTAAAGDKIGVAECDDFIAKYDDCISKHVPEAARAQYRASIDQWRKSWRDLAANPQTKPTLAQACKQAAETARQTMTSYNCSF